MTTSPQDPRASTDKSLIAQYESTLPAHPAFTPPSPMWLDAGQKEESLNVVGFLHSLRRRWLPGALIGSVVASIIAAILFVVIPVSYEAVGLLRVRLSQRDLLSGRRSSVSDQREYEVFKQTQAALMTSPYVLTAALRDSEIQNLGVIAREEKPLGMLQGELRVDYPGKSEILRVAFRSDENQEAIKIVDAVMNAYLEEIAQEDRDERVARLDVLRREHRDNVRKIQELNETVHRLAEEIGTTDSEEAKMARQMETSTLHTLDKQRLDLQTSLQKLQGDLFVLTSTRRSRVINPSPYEIEDYLESDPDYMLLKRTINEAEKQMSMMAGMVKRPTAAVSGMQAQLASLKKDLDDRRRELRPRIENRIRSRYADEIAETTGIQAIQAQIAVSQELYKTTAEQYEEQYEKLKDLIGFSADLETKKSELENLQATTDEISDEISRLQINLQNPPRIIKVQDAMIPDHNSAWLRTLEVIAGWIGTFALCVLGIAVWDYFSQRMNVPKELETAVGVSVIGSLPSLRKGAFSLGGGNQEALVTDSIDSIRAAISYGDRGKQTSSVLVTSALGQEGKSTVASQLAVSLARGGRKTLLIDGDVRNPQQHNVFGLPPDRGLCDVLRGQTSLEEVVQATPAENLWILPSGRCDTVSFQALSGPTIGVAMDRLKQQFEFIVVDTGPVLTGPEALIFGQHVDGAVVSTRRDVSRIPKVDEAYRRLQSVGVEVIGAVVNGTAAESRPNRLALVQAS